MKILLIALLLLFALSASAHYSSGHYYYSSVPQSPVIYYYPRMPVSYTIPQLQGQAYPQFQGQGYPQLQGQGYFQQPLLNYYYYYPNYFLSNHYSRTTVYPTTVVSTPRAFFRETTIRESTAKEFTIYGTEYSFSPRNIEVTQGERVRIRFVNTGTIAHTYTVNELGLDTGLLEAGEERTLEFTVPKRTNLTLISYCRVPGHREQGMFGRIIIN